MPQREPRGSRAVAARMRHGATGQFIPSSLILSHTWLPKPRVVRLTAKGVNNRPIFVLGDAVGPAFIADFRYLSRLANFTGIGPKRLAGIIDSVAPRIGRVRGRTQAAHTAISQVGE